jgi:ribonuclease P protein component
MAIATLKRRSEFLRIRGGRRWSTPAFVIEMRARGRSDGSMPSNEVQDEAAAGGHTGPPRFGFTATKKLGNAVMRNRIRRRLKELVRLTAPAHARDGHDYVLIARSPAATRSFGDLERDLITALAELHAPQRNTGRGSTTPRRSAPRTPSTSSRT